MNKKGNLGGKIFFLLFFGLFICTVGGSLLDSCIKLYKVNKIYTDTCTVKCTDYEYSDQYEDNSSDDYNRSYYYVLCIFTYTGNYNGVNISYKSQDTMSCMPEKGLDLRVKDLKNEFWLNSEQKQFLKDTKARLGTIKILNVNPKESKGSYLRRRRKSKYYIYCWNLWILIYIYFFVLLIIWIYSNHPTEREIEKTKKQRELMKENEQDNIEKMMKSFDKELLKEKGKGNEIQDRDKSL